MENNVSEAVQLATIVDKPNLILIALLSFIVGLVIQQIIK